MEQIKKLPKDEFVALIADGRTEPELLEYFKFRRELYVLLLVKDKEFKERVEEAKRIRADKWFEDIARDVNRELDKEQVAAAKLKFEQRKYLAAIDNPDKYGERVKHQHDVTVNIFQEMKDLPTARAREILAASDPFAIAKAPVEVEYREVRPVVEERTEEEKKALMEPMELEEELSDEEIFT